VTRHGHALRRRHKLGVDAHLRQTEWPVEGGVWQPIGRGRELHREHEPGTREEWQAQDPETAHLQQPGEGRRRTGDQLIDLDAVISHQEEASVDQPQCHVRLAAAGRSQQQHSHSVTCSTARMDLHGNAP
jgi:hypothetical protein